MIKNNFFVLQIKKMIFPFLFCLFTLSLILFSRTNISAAKEGISLWSSSVLPSLFPFFIATNLLSYTNIPKILGRILGKIMQPLFHVPGEGAFAFIMGIISGYPMGAKIVCDLYKSKNCTQEEAERLLAFTNNSGPLFIIGTVGVVFLGDSRIGLLLFFTHIMACISVGIVFRWWKNNKNVNLSTKKNQSYRSSYNGNIRLNHLGEMLSSSIMNSFSSIVMVGGFIILFSIISSMLNQSHFFNVIEHIFSFLKIDARYIRGLLSGMLEITNGLKQVSMVPNKMLSVNICISAFLLGFGGLSVLLQVLSICSKSNIPIKPYFIGKLLHACFATFYTYIILKYSIFFNVDIIETAKIPFREISMVNYNLIIAIILVFTSLFYIKKLLKRA